MSNPNHLFWSVCSNLRQKITLLLACRGCTRREASSDSVGKLFTSSGRWTRGGSLSLENHWRPIALKSSIGGAELRKNYFFDKVSYLLGKISAQRLISSAFDVGKKLLFVGVPKGRSSCEALVDDNSEQVPVQHLCVSPSPKHFRSQIGSTSAERVGKSCLLAETKVCEACVTLVVNNDVARFEISIDDLCSVESFDS